MLQKLSLFWSLLTGNYVLFVVKKERKKFSLKILKGKGVSRKELGSLCNVLSNKIMEEV